MVGSLDHRTKRIVREEVGRTAVWLFFSLIGWSLVLASSPGVDATMPTFLGAVAVTAIGMSAVVVAIRIVTGRELTGGTASKDLVLLTTLFVVSFYLLWATLSARWTTLTTGLAIVAVLTVVVRIVRPATFGYE